MSTATARLASMGDTTAVRQTIVRAGTNCWRVDLADRFHCVQDGADYFRWVREALLGARKSVFILGWDILAAVDLLPDAGPLEAPTRLSELLAYIARRRPRLRCYILIWDYAALYTLERDPLSRWRLGWQMPRRVRFGFDDRHPVGSSHHQKIIVVDDRLAFCGGIDLTGHRWDTSAHRVHEPARVSARGPYGPYHEVQAMVSGPVAASLGVLARDRWRALGEERLPAISPSHEDLLPSDLTADLTDVDVAIARTVPGSEKHLPIRECESLFLDSIAAARRSIYIESQYFTNDRLSEALAARLRERDGPEVIVVAPKDCDGWLERNTMGAFRDKVFRLMIDADHHKRLRLVYPIASRAENVPTFVHSKVMVVDDVLVRIGSANFSRRSMAVDTECDLAVDAAGDPRARGGVQRIRDRLLAEHLGLPVEAVAREIERAGSVRSLIDQRVQFEHTLMPIEVAREHETADAAALQAVADPDEPIGFGSAVAELVPPADATYRHSPLRLRIVPAVVLAVAVASIWSAWNSRPEFQAVRDALVAVPSMPSIAWIGVAAFLLTNLLMIPLELLAFAAGLLFGATRGGLVSLLGSLGAAAIGYAAGRAIGAAGITRWMSGRSYRSARQLGARGMLGVLVLRLASVASAGSIHLLCGAGKVPFAIYMAGSAIGLVPAAVALSGLGALVRHVVLHPSLSNGVVAIGAAVLLVALAAGLRTFLLIRQFAPSVSNQRRRAEFG
jgi:phospholipase D1/2